MPERKDAVVEQLVDQERRQHHTVNADAAAGDHRIAEITPSSVIEKHPQHHDPSKAQHADDGIGDGQIAVEIDIAVCPVRHDVEQPYAEGAVRFLDKLITLVKTAPDPDIRFPLADSVEFEYQLAVLHIIVRKLHNPFPVEAYLDDRLDLNHRKRVCVQGIVSAPGDHDRRGKNE